MGQAGDREVSHTKGLLATNHDRIESKDEHGWINDGWIIAQCQGPDAVANTRRLVACWNEHDELVAERDEALAALRNLAEWANKYIGSHIFHLNELGEIVRDSKAILSRYQEEE